MPTRILNSNDCERLVDPLSLVAALEMAHVQLANGGAVQPVPQKMRAPGDEATDAKAVVPMGAFAPYLDLVAIKVLIDAPRNRAAGLPAQRSTVSLYSATTGECLALIDGRALTRIRTAAATALASRTLARSDSSVVGILGAGPLAREHIKYLRRVLPIADVRIWSPSGTSAAALASEVDGDGLRAVAVESPEQVFDGADVVCTLTPSREPLIDPSWVLPGLHLNAVGSPPRPGYRELPGSVFTIADVVAVDARQVALAESDNVIHAIAEGGLDPARVAELGEIILGTSKGRESDSDVTVFNSIGVGLQDLAAAAHVLAQADVAKCGELADARS